MKDDRLISLNAAIDALNKKWRTCIIGESLIRDVGDTLKTLPSAQPSVSKTEIVGDVISRAAVLNLIEQSCCDLEYDCDNVALRKEVEALPSAQPSVSKEEMVGDAVSRQGVLRLLNAVPSEEFATKAMLISGVNALPSAPGWIPCSRELPKPNEEDGNGFHKAYLVQDGRWMDVARWDGKYWIAWGYSTVLLNVVAWMPLPAPYIPEGDDKHEG